MTRRVGRNQTSTRGRICKSLAGDGARQIGGLVREARVEDDAIGGTEVDRIAIDGLRITIFSDRPEAVAGLALVPIDRRMRAQRSPREIRISANEQIQVS